MKLYLKFDSRIACRKLLQEQLGKLNMQFSFSGFSEIDIDDAVSGSGLDEINATLCDYGIEIIQDQKSILVQKIKDIISEMINMEEKPHTNNSTYISDKLKQHYYYLSYVFAESTNTTIAQYFILQKLEKAKQLISTNQVTFTEISYLLNYSSLAHFSSQFKGAIGVSPSTFQRILNRRLQQEVTA